MKNRLIPVFTAILNLLILQVSYGQDKSDITNLLRKAFNDYCKSVPREELYVQTDRDDYISGEEIWFSTILFNRKGNTPLLTNSIAYFEILNSENRPVLQKRIRLADGFGSGQAVLPDSLRSGVYLIRAYTNYMKNFLPENCFMKEIRILNALNPSAAVSVKTSGAVKDYSKNANRFGGSGLSLTIDRKNADDLDLNIISDDRYRIDNGSVFYLFIQAGGEINRVSKEWLADGKCRIPLSAAVLSQGITQITILNSKGRPAAERYFYTPEKNSSVLSIKTEESVSKRSRISLEVDIQGELKNVNKASGISVSVAPVNSVSRTSGIVDYLVFASEFGIIPSSLSAEGKISDIPSMTMDSLLNGISSNWIDWNRIISGKVPAIKFKKESDSHYLSGKLISKSSQQPDSGKYVFLSSPGKTAVFQYAKTDRDGNFTFRLMNDQKINDLIIQPADAGKNSTVKTESSFSENYLLPGNSSIASYDEFLRSHFSKLSVNYQVNRIYGVTSLGSRNAPVIIPVRKLRFYGTPDIELIMADYIKLPVMQEVFFELLPGTTLKNKRSVYEITISDPVTNKVFEVPPVLMIDGVIINDPALIANIDPEIVERIDVAREKYYVGDYMFYGIINVITKSGDFSCVQLPAYTVRIPYRVTEPEWTFTSPDYSTDEKKSGRIPDFRNTLYWNPLVTPGTDGKAKVDFWSSDQAGEYIINVQGVGTDGKSVSVSKIITVK